MIQEENKDTLINMANTSAEIATKFSSAVKKGMAKETKPCKYCGAKQ